MNRYDLLSVKTALEVLYACGYVEVCVDDFISIFCERYDLSQSDEESRIMGMLRVLDKNGKIQLGNEKIRMWNMLSTNIRLIINK